MCWNSQLICVPQSQKLANSRHSGWDGVGECTALRELPNSLIKEVSLDGIMKDTEEINSLKGFFLYEGT